MADAAAVQISAIRGGLQRRSGAGAGRATSAINARGLSLPLRPAAASSATCAAHARGQSLSPAARRRRQTPRWPRPPAIAASRHQAPRSSRPAPPPTTAARRRRRQSPQPPPSGPVATSATRRPPPLLPPTSAASHFCGPKPCGARPSARNAGPDLPNPDFPAPAAQPATPATDSAPRRRGARLPRSPGCGCCASSAMFLPA
jgi:hypothetical protein